MFRPQCIFSAFSFIFYLCIYGGMSTWLQCLGSPEEPAGSPGAVARGDCELGHGASGRQVRDLNHRAIAPVPIPRFSKRCVMTPMWGCKAECGRGAYGKFGNDERFLNVQQMNSPVVLAWAAACAFPAAWAPNTQHPHLALIMLLLHTHQHMLPRHLSSAMTVACYEWHHFYPYGNITIPQMH